MCMHGVMYQVLGFDHSLLIAAERCRVLFQLNETQALREEWLKQEFSRGVVWDELIFLV